MIGNDIVDLQVAAKESNWRRPGYLQKIFTPHEQEFIYSAKDSALAVWLLWSSKESAYKIISRMTQRQFYAPKKIVNQNMKYCAATAEFTSQIAFEEYTFFTKSKGTKKYIHTIARREQNEEPISTGSFFLPNTKYATQQRYTRRNLLQQYARQTKLPVSKLSIQKDKFHIPHLFYQHQRQPSVVSISHHGHFGGFIFQSDNTIN